MTMRNSRLGPLSTAGFLLVMFGNHANAATTVLDPGPGTDYLGISCGGQTVNEIATGFDPAANAVTLVKVATTCHGSGRGSLNQYYLACWTVTFAEDGGLLSKEWQATNHWVQGTPAIPCPVPADPAAVYTFENGSGSLVATLSTASIGTTSPVYRAVLETACLPLELGGAVAGTIAAPGGEDCYSFSGLAGDGVRVDVERTSGALLPVADLLRPDGTLLCSAGSGSADCDLDASGRYVVLVHDSAATESGGYSLALSCITPSCSPVVRTENTSATIAYSAPWNLYASTGASGGSASYTKTTSAIASFSFIGTEVKLVAATGPMLGNALVTLDGVGTTVDLYAASLGIGPSPYERVNLPYGPHTLTIAPKGTKNLKSTNYFVDLDAIDTR